MKGSMASTKNPDFSQFCNAHDIQNSTTANYKKRNI